MPSAHEILEESLRSVAIIEESSDRANAHIDVVEGFMLIGQLESARALLPEAKTLCNTVDQKDQRDFLYRLLAQVAAEFAEIAFVEDLAKNIANPEEKHKVIEEIVWHLCRRENLDLEAALGYLDWIKDDEDAFGASLGIIVAKMAEIGFTGRAIEIINSKLVPEDRIAHLNCIVRILLSNEQCDEATRLLESIRLDPGFGPDDFASEAYRLAEMHRIDEARTIAADFLEHDKMLLEIRISNSMAKCGNIVGAKTVLEEILAKAIAYDDRLIMLNTAKSLHSIGEREKSIDIFRKLIAFYSKDMRQRMQLVNYAYELSKLGEKTAAIRLLKVVFKHIESSLSGLTLFHIAGTVRVCLKFDFVAEALEAMERIEELLQNSDHRDIEPESANQILAVQFGRIAGKMLQSDIFPKSQTEELLEKSLDIARNMADPIRRAAALCNIGIALGGVIR